jgi:uncharacterized damage-inducible protein DinB
MATDLRYPIGTFSFPEQMTSAQCRQWIDEIAAAPAALRSAVADLSPEQLDTPYRPGGWTVRQLVHHVPDSHMNAYIRMRLALTEDEPTIKPYEEARWAELPDVRTVPIAVSLALLEALHERWLGTLRALSAADLQRGFRHPEYGRLITIGQALAMYAWHGRHHVAHITALRERSGW